MKACRIGRITKNQVNKLGYNRFLEISIQKITHKSSLFGMLQLLEDKSNNHLFKSENSRQASLFKISPDFRFRKSCRRKEKVAAPCAK